MQLRSKKTILLVFIQAILVVLIGFVYGLIDKPGKSNLPFMPKQATARPISKTVISDQTLSAFLRASKAYETARSKVKRLVTGAKNQNPNREDPETEAREAIGLLSEVSELANDIDRKQLNALYPALGDHFLDEFVPSAVVYLAGVRTGDLAKANKSNALYAQWLAWRKQNEDGLRRLFSSKPFEQRFQSLGIGTHDLPTSRSGI